MGFRGDDDNFYKEVIPDTDFELAAIDTTLTADPPSADAANSIVDIDQVDGRTFALRSLVVNVTSFGTGSQMTFALWVLLNGTVTRVKRWVVRPTGLVDLMDLFGVS